MSLLSRLLRFQGSNGGLEDFFTEIFAHLLSTYSDLCLAWLNESGVLPLNEKYSHIHVTTQRPFGALEGHSYSSRPDVVIELSESFSTEVVDGQHSDEAPVPPTDVVFIESKVGSREGQDQLRRYAEHLSALPNVRHRRLVYITRDYDPKDEDEIVGGPRVSDAPVGFVPLRWHGFYRTLENYRSTSLPGSDLTQEVLLFMKQHGMSQTNRLSAADVVALSGMSRMLAFMRETLSGEVETRMRKVSRGRVLKGNLALNQLATFDRYFYYSQMGPEFWVGGGFSLGQDAPDDYPWLSVILEVGPNQPGRDEIISAMRSFAAGSSRCEPYDLDNPAAWSGLDWAIDLRELLTAEDHMAAARVHLLKSLDDVARMQEKYPRLPWERDV